MKFFCTTVLVALFAWATAFGQSCLPEGITFLSQGQVDSFSVNYPGCSMVEGNVEIAMPGTNLNGLAALKFVRGNLTIKENPSLINLQGLNHLDSVGGDLVIGSTTFSISDSLYTYGMPSLRNLQGLDSLVTVGGIIGIQQNPALKAIHGLTRLTSAGELWIYRNASLFSIAELYHLDSVSGDVTIGYNDSLTYLSGLEQLTTIGGNLSIKSNTNLLNIDALSNVINFDGDLNIGGNKKLVNIFGLHNIKDNINGILISHNDALTSLHGLENITSVSEDINFIGARGLKNLDGLNNISSADNLIIQNCPSFNNLSGLDNLRQINGYLDIYNNRGLHSINGLNRLQSVAKDFFVHYNDSLVSLAGLRNLSYIGASSYITNNAVLHDLSGLDSLYSVQGNFGIIKNASLTDLSTLAHLSSVGSLRVDSNDSLTTLHGLQQLQSIGGNLIIYNNGVLDNIYALGNLHTVGDTLSIVNNPALDNCAVFPVCQQLSYQPQLVAILNNGFGCDSPYAVELACGGLPVLATVRLDYNGNCQVDSTDAWADGVLVRLFGPNQQQLRSTQSDGVAKFGYLDNGPFSLSLPQFPTDNWEICQDTLWFLPDTIQDTIRANFLLKPLNQCPQLTVDLGLPPFFRGCLVTSPMQVVTRNIGTIPAEAARVAVVLPEGLELVSSIPAVAFQSSDTLFFDLGELSPFLASTVNMVVKTSCAAVQDGQALCLEAFATWANPCPITTPPASEIRLFSECMNDTTVRFTIKNVGDAATLNAHEYVIIEDEVILHSAPFQLNPFEILTVDVPTDGATYRMEATKYDDGTLTATALESCGGFTPGFITAYWLNDGLRDYDFDCREIRAAYDPNQKTAIPTGVGPEHLLAANKPIQYTIDFQNTGTDTAFRVQLLDILSPQLNVNTFRPGFSSHPYTWEIRGADTLEVLFYPIMLPDSNVNETASHGWFSFEIDQKPDLPDGTTIENTAAIVFDYNPPIITNTVFHTIGKLTVSVDELQQPGAYWQVLSNPTRYAAIFRAKEFVAGEKRFELSDALGRVVRTEHFSGQEFEFQRGLLPGGLYYFHIYDARGKGVTGKIVLSD